jgi:hypothetical protein
MFYERDVWCGCIEAYLVNFYARVDGQIPDAHISQHALDGLLQIEQPERARRSEKHT